MNKVSKIIAVFLLMTIFLSFGINVSAEGEETAIILQGSKSVVKGNIVEIKVYLNFAEDILAYNGVSVLNCGIEFDPSVFIPVDPETYEPITQDESGAKTGNYVLPGDVIGDNSISGNLTQAGNKIVLLYGDLNSTSITEPGVIAKLAFLATGDIEINESINTSINISDNPYTSGSIYITNEEGTVTDIKAVKYNTLTKGWQGTIVPNFTLGKVNNVNSGGELKLSGTYVPLEYEEPIHITIANSSGNIVLEDDVEIDGFKFNFNATMDEELFPLGTYKIILSQFGSKITRLFDVVDKKEIIIPDPVVPEDPVDPIEPDDGENEIPGGNTGSDNSGNTGSDNTGSGNTGSDSTDKPTKPDKTDKNGIDFEGGIVTGIKNDNTTPKPGTTEKEEPKVERPKAESYPTDIAEHWAKSNIEYVYDYKLMNGYSDGTFGADNSITRAEFATVMSRFLELDENPSAAGFDDTADHWAKGYIGALAAKGIVGGVSDTEFEPDSNITREQIAVILNRAFSLKAATETGTFTDDACISDWAYDGVYNVLSAGYMKGDTAGNFNPLSNATRAEVATIIFRLHSAK